MIYQSKSAGYGKFFAFVIAILLLGACSEDITINFEEDERWTAVAYYDQACTSADSPYCQEMERVIEEAEDLGIHGSRMGERVILEGQDYESLEAMLDRSLCCQSALIELRDEEGEPRIHFSLSEKDSDREEWGWTITLVGGEIISSNGTSTGERGETEWSVGSYEYSYEHRPKEEMAAVLTPKAGPRNPLLLPIVMIGAIASLIILLVVFWFLRWRRAFWLLSALFIALICVLLFIPFLFGQDSSQSDCSPECVNFNPSVVDLYGGECLEYYYPGPEECSKEPADPISVINRIYDSYREADLLRFIATFCACGTGLLVSGFIFILARRVGYRIPFSGSRLRKKPANPTNQLPDHQKNAGVEEEVLG